LVAAIAVAPICRVGRYHVPSKRKRSVWVGRADHP
jgi:hypothetical protein